MSRYCPAIEYTDKYGKKQIEFCTSFDGASKRLVVLQCVECATNVCIIRFPVHNYNPV